MDAAQLRARLREHVVGLKDFVTHGKLPDLCRELGLPEPLPCGPEVSKGDRLRASFDALPDAELPRLVENVVKYRRLSASSRNELQDLAWFGEGPAIPKRFRREIAQAIEALELFKDGRRFDSLLDRLWVLDNPTEWFVSGRSLRDDIEQHVHRNPEDWSVETLFDLVGAFDCGDRRFCLFLEGLASADVRPDESAQRRFVGAVNIPLRSCRAELRETGSRDGYPVFTVTATGSGSQGRPKNLIFVSSVKPDLRFRDAIDNDIEIVTNAERVLVYDRPISVSGLRWRDLQEWWAEIRGIENPEEAKRSLYLRLRDSLPSNSPAQRRLFEGFYRAFGAATPGLPALLPEVWLHWDPKTVEERGPDALARFRMDFLLLLPDGFRIVIEVDGKHHYSDGAGQADSSRYAAMVAADRDLRLAGYEVFRFGVAELTDDSASELALKTFFVGLFKRYGVGNRP